MLVSAYGSAPHRGRGGIQETSGYTMPTSALFEAGAVGPRIGAATLVVHDRQDAMNRFDDGQAFADAIPGACLMATDGLGHRKILKDAAVLEAIARFAL